METNGTGDALVDLYNGMTTAIEHCWRQKMRFRVKYDYHKLAKLYWHFICCPKCSPDHPHAKEHKEKHHPHGEKHSCLSCLKHQVTCRLEQLERDFTSVLGDVPVNDDIKPALEATKRVLQGCWDAAGVILLTTTDHPTQKIAGDAQVEVARFLACVEAQLRQVADLRDNYPIVAV